MTELADTGLLPELVKYLAAQIIQQEEIITEFVTTCSEERLALLLLRLAKRSVGRDGSRLILEERISCQDLAQMVGTTRSRIGLFLKRFRELDLVRSGKTFFLSIDAPRLRQYLDEHFGTET
ncbi:MAG: helix-turn-helix domain-containing protein [Myxococcota bacterium]